METFRSGFTKRSLYTTAKFVCFFMVRSTLLSGWFLTSRLTVCERVEALRCMQKTRSSKEVNFIIRNNWSVPQIGPFFLPNGEKSYFIITFVRLDSLKN